MFGVRRALVADDSSANRVDLGKFLEWMGVKVVLAENGVKAIEIYERDPSFDIVVLGRMNAGMDSFTVAKLIRQFQVAKRPCIVGVGDLNDFSERTLKAGMDTFMVYPKPPEIRKEVTTKQNVLAFIKGGV